MTDPRLRNPVWHALASSQSAFALRHGRVARFPAPIAPFVAVESADAVPAEDLFALVEPGETVDFVGVAPPLDARWQCAAIEQIAQMHVDTAIPLGDGAPIEALGDAAAEQMFTLTRLVYPGYFRPRTRELGAYYGIFAGGRLVAMAGERMRIGEWQEVSAVCTHPEHVGRGHAQRLVAHLVNAIIARGQRPFLHVSTANARAIRLYEHLGFERRGVIDLVLAERLAT